MGAGRIESANSYLQLFYEGGWIGAAIGFTVLLSLGRLSLTGGRAATAVYLGALTNGVFESWLFAGGSLFFVVLWLAVVALSPESGVRNHPPRSHSLGQSSKAVMLT